ncbi:MAG TPA: YceI family protein [Actinomycetota bacterium]|nr:YceI family protein [Actinomycetota bacterium]
MAWQLDPAHTQVGFTARHMGLSKVRGRFTNFDGTIDLDPANPTSARGRVAIDLASIETGNADRDAHLRSPDFFDVDNHPKMVFDVKSLAPAGDDHYKVVGDLTIKGTTNQIELDLEYTGEGTDPYGNRKVGGSLSGTINRSDWGLTWNVALETGGWLVSDKIKIEIEGQLAEAVKTERSAA